MVDLVALKAKIAARKAAAIAELTEQPVSQVVQPVQTEEKQNETTNSNPVPDTTTTNTMVANNIVPSAGPLVGAGTARTVSIDHMDFLTKVQELGDAILAKHPRMPVLLATIHKQIAADPELVTVLSEEEIGTIVNGLKVQTKTEMVGTILKQSKAREKKTVLSADMF